MHRGQVTNRGVKVQERAAMHNPPFRPLTGNNHGHRTNRAPSSSIRVTSLGHSGLS